METNKPTLFRLYGKGEIPTEFASAVLTRMHCAYDGLRVLDALRSLSVTDFREAQDTYLNGTFGIVGESYLSHLYEPLELKGVVLQSPGFWEFLGRLNPLETLRQYLNERHERKKDIAYRNSLEKERLSIENRILKAKLVSDVVAIAKQAGMREERIEALIRDHAIVPLLRLEPLQDREIITYAEIPQEISEDAYEKMDA